MDMPDQFQPVGGRPLREALRQIHASAHEKHGIHGDIRFAKAQNRLARRKLVERLLKRAERWWIAHGGPRL
jgi:hypothetical protein